MLEGPLCTYRVAKYERTTTPTKKSAAARRYITAMKALPRHSPRLTSIRVSLAPLAAGCGPGLVGYITRQIFILFLPNQVASAILPPHRLRFPPPHEAGGHLCTHIKFPRLVGVVYPHERDGCGVHALVETVACELAQKIVPLSIDVFYGAH